MRCTRCGHLATNSDKFCAECGMFLRDAYVDHRSFMPWSQSARATIATRGVWSRS